MVRPRNVIGGDAMGCKLIFNVIKRIVIGLYDTFGRITNYYENLQSCIGNNLSG